MHLFLYSIQINLLLIKNNDIIEILDIMYIISAIFI